jgi:hypothetical protein
VSIFQYKVLMKIAFIYNTFSITLYQGYHDMNTEKNSRHCSYLLTSLIIKWTIFLKNRSWRNLALWTTTPVLLPRCYTSYVVMTFNVINTFRWGRRWPLSFTFYEGRMIWREKRLVFTALIWVNYIEKSLQRIKRYFMDEWVLPESDCRHRVVSIVQ